MHEIKGQLTSERLGDVDVVGLVSDKVSLRSNRPAPPGTRITATGGDSSSLQIAGKVVSIKAEDVDPPQWTIDVKLFSMGKALAKELRSLASLSNVG